MTSALLPAVIVGGIAYELVESQSNPIPPQSHPGYTGAAYPGQPLGTTTQIAGMSPIIKGLISSSRQYFISNPTARQTAWPSDGNLDPQIKAKLDTVEAAAQKAFNDANEVAKAKAADQLNKSLKLDPPLNGHEDWETVSAVVGGATGGAIGGAIGGPIGAKLGAMAGAYLGVKLEDLLAKNLDEIEDWVKGKWGDVEDFAKDVYDDAAGLWPF
jgi:hypothetical protein